VHRWRFTIPGSLRSGPVQDILEAAEEAGRQLAQEGAMSPATLKRVSREITPLDRFVTTSNKICRQVLDAMDEKATF
jgi:hypothetical protein